MEELTGSGGESMVVKPFANLTWTRRASPSPEALERCVACEPQWRVHEAVFAVLALGSEPVDPRLLTLRRRLPCQIVRSTPVRAASQARM